MAELNDYPPTHPSILKTARVKELALAIESISDGFLACDQDGIITYANPRLYKLMPELLQWPEKSLASTLIDKLTGQIYSNQLQESLLKKEERIFDFEHRPTKSWYHVSIYPFLKGASIHFREITVYKKALEDATKAKRLYAFISEVNEVVLRAKTAEEIFRTVCKIAIDTGGFLLAWVGYKNMKTHIIEPYCAEGPGVEYLTAIKNITTDNVPAGHGPSGTAMREGRYIYSNDISTDPVMTIWKEEALKYGFQSSIALPLMLNHETTALLTLYAPVTHAFSSDEIRLLTQVADNISFGLQAISTSAKRKEAETQLLKVSQAVKQSDASIVITDVAGNIEYVNPAFCKLSGYTKAEVLGKNPKILKAGFTPPEVYKKMWMNLTRKKNWQGEMCNRNKSGELYWESATISPILDAQKNITHYVAVKENITEKKKLDEDQKMLAKIIENTSAYVAIAKMNRQFVYINNALKEAIGIEATEDVTTFNLDSIRTEMSIQKLDEMNIALKEHGKWIGENSYRTKSGNEIFVWMVVILHPSMKGEDPLLSTTAIDISDLKQEQSNSEHLNKELRELSNYLQKISELEKKEIAREIHDDLGQKLTALKFDAAWLKKHVRNATIEKLDERIDDMLHIINETSDAFRRIHTSLHPAMLEDMGLKKSLEWMIRTFEKKTSIPVTYHSNLEEKKNASSTDIVVYRIVQECLTNIMRYAHANKVCINMETVADTLTMEIEDDGVGFDTDKVDTSLHHGLLGVRERLVAIQGHLSIRSAPGRGTYISVVIPIPLAAVHQYA
jgi:PAS domain S-box-containing protein